MNYVVVAREIDASEGIIDDRVVCNLCVIDGAPDSDIVRGERVLFDSTIIVPVIKSINTVNAELVLYENIVDDADVVSVDEDASVLDVGTAFSDGETGNFCWSTRVVKDEDVLRAV